MTISKTNTPSDNKYTKKTVGLKSKKKIASNQTNTKQALERAGKPPVV